MKRTIIPICIFLAFLIVIQVRFTNGSETALVFGDSNATGIASDAALRATISDKPEPEETNYQEDNAQYVRSYDYASAYVENPYYESDDVDAEIAAKEWIAQKESGGDYEARNGQYIGRYQLNEMYLDGDFSKDNQERAANEYIQDRYGSWQAAKEFWLENGWY